MNNIYLILNSLLYLGVFLWIYYRRRYLSLGANVFLLYFLFSLVAIDLFYDPFSVYFFDDLSFSPFIYLWVMVTLISWPLIRFNEKRVEKIIIPNENLMFLFTLFVVSMFILSSIEIVGSMNKILVNLVLETSAAADIYEKTRTTTNSSEGANILGVIVPALRDFPQFLLFFYLTKNKINRFVISLLILALIISLLSGLLNGLRGNVIFVLFSSIFCYLLFSKFYTNQVKKKVKLGLIIGLIAVSIPFIAISIGRFMTPTSGVDSGYALKTYVGQSFIYFNNHGLDANGFRYGDRTMNLFKRLISDDVPKGWDNLRQKYNKMTMDDSVFSTFVGEFTLDFGPVAVFILFSIISTVIVIVTYKYRVLYFHQILLLYFIWNTLTYGIFLFPYADISGNIRIIFFILLYWVFKFNSSSTNFILQNPTSNRKRKL